MKTILEKFELQINNILESSISEATECMIDKMRDKIVSELDEPYAYLAFSDGLLRIGVDFTNEEGIVRSFLITPEGLDASDWKRKADIPDAISNGKGNGLDAQGRKDAAAYLRKLADAIDA